MYSDRDEYVEESKYYYCGNKPEVPEGYCTFGTRNRCLKKGYGAALYKDEPRRPVRMVKCSKKALKVDRPWTEYQKFIHDNFQNTQRRMGSRRPTDVLSELAKQWKRLNISSRQRRPSPRPIIQSRSPSSPRRRRSPSSPRRSPSQRPRSPRGRRQSRLRSFSRSPSRSPRRRIFNEDD
jgi:hypothetical protein